MLELFIARTHGGCQPGLAMSCSEPARPLPPARIPAVGAILGFSMVYGGVDAVNWATPDPKKFPPYNGAVPIFCTWIFAPIATATASAITVLLLRTFVLRRPNPAKLSLFVLPIAVFITSWICIYFVFTKVCRAGCCGCS
jgi:hypothetical protein